MLDIFAALGFAGFVLIGLVTARGAATADPAARRRRANLLILYVVTASFAAGLGQRDLWPFSSWTLMAGAAPAQIGAPPLPASVRAVAVDAAGREHAIDYRAWQPLNVEEITTWWHSVLPTLTDAERRRVGSRLLDHVNEARAAVRAGHRPGSFQRVLGPLAAPTHSLHPAIWTDPQTVPADPFVAIRLYQEFYEVEARRRDPGSVRRELAYEFTGDR